MISIGDKSGLQLGQLSTHNASTGEFCWSGALALADSQCFSHLPHKWAPGFSHGWRYKSVGCVREGMWHKNIAKSREWMELINWWNHEFRSPPENPEGECPANSSYPKAKAMFDRKLTSNLWLNIDFQVLISVVWFILVLLIPWDAAVSFLSSF